MSLFSSLYIRLKVSTRAITCAWCRQGGIEDRIAIASRDTPIATPYIKRFSTPYSTGPSQCQHKQVCVAAKVAQEYRTPQDTKRELEGSKDVLASTFSPSYICSVEVLL